MNETIDFLEREFFVCCLNEIKIYKKGSEQNMWARKDSSMLNYYIC